MYSPTLLDHFQNPRNAGELDSPTATVEVSNPVCGDILRLGVRMEAGVVSAARFKAKGCTACVAMGSTVTELLLGRAAVGIASVTAADIETALGGLQNESKHVAALGADAVKALSSKLAQAERS